VATNSPQEKSAIKPPFFTLSIGIANTRQDANIGKKVFKKKGIDRLWKKIYTDFCINNTLSPVNSIQSIQQYMEKSLHMRKRGD